MNNIDLNTLQMFRNYSQKKNTFKHFLLSEKNAKINRDLHTTEPQITLQETQYGSYI